MDIKIKNFRIFFIIFCFGTIVSVLGTLSYPFDNFVSIFWPAAAIQATAGILFGWWGVLAGVLFPFTANCLAGCKITVSLCYIPANFIQVTVPMLLVRYFNMKPTLSGAKDWFKFIFWGMLVAQGAAAFVAVSLLYNCNFENNFSVFIRFILVWLTGNVPYVLIFGSLFLKILVPILSGTDSYYIPSSLARRQSKGNTVFLKIFIWLMASSILPYLLFTMFELIHSKTITYTKQHPATSIAFGIGFLVSIVIAGLITRDIIRPITLLLQNIKNYRTQKALPHFEGNREDEFGYLFKEYELMIHEIEDFNSKLVETTENLHKTEIEAAHDHAIAEVAFGVAHEVKRPFTSMTSLLGLLPSLTPDDIKKESEIVDITLRKVLSLLDGITDYAREDKYDLTPGNILSALDLSIKDISRYNPNKKVDFYYQLEILPLVNSDELRICRALENIIANAFDFLPEKEGFMWFSTKAKGKTAEIVIGNSHSHIPDDKIEHLFEKMFTFGKKKGTGLGLGIVKKVINGHNGKVFARNVEQPASFVPEDRRCVGGVEFVMALPLTDQPGYELKDPLLKNSTEAKIVPGMIEKEDQLAGASEVSALTEKLKQQKPNLLILDDESIYRMRVRDVLKKLGDLNDYVSTYDASSYKEAVAVLGQTKIDFLICDIDLMDRKHDGFSVLSEAIDKYPTCRVLMHTNRKDPQDIKQAKKLGACGFCPKPITEAILVDLLLDNELWPNAKRKKASKRPTQNTVEYVKGIPNSVLLLVNDDAVILQYEKESLEKVIDPKDNIRIFTVKTYDEAIDIIRKEKVNILISDFYLDSETTGVEICKLVRRKNPVSVCIIASGIVTGERLKTQTDCVDEFFSVPPFNAKQQLETAFKMLQEKLNKQNA